MNPTIKRPLLVHWLAWAGAALAVCAGCKPGHATLKYETAPVARGALVQYVSASGTLNAVVSVDVGSQVSGKIIAINVDFNSPVKKGQLVAEIDTNVYAASLRQAVGQLASAKADVTLKRQNLERKKILVPQQAATSWTWIKPSPNWRKRRPRLSSKRRSWKAPRPISITAKSPPPWTALSSRARWTWARQ